MCVQNPQAASCEARVTACLPLAEVLSARQGATSMHTQSKHLDAELPASGSRGVGHQEVQDAGASGGLWVPGPVASTLHG